MAKTKLRTEFGAALVESLSEVAAWKRGEVALPVRVIPTMSAERVRTIRKSVAKSPKEFSARFGIPARTLEGWEQGRRRPDPTASILLRVIETNPKAVEDAIADQRTNARAEEIANDRVSGQARS